MNSNLISYISGTPVTQIARFDNYEHTIVSSDLFLISLQYLHDANIDRKYEYNGLTYINSYCSKNFSYNLLSTLIFSELIDELGFRTMSSEESSDYSEIDHLHNFSIISAYSNSDSGDLSNFAFQLIIDSDPIRFYSPITKPISYSYTPLIGLLKFIAIDTLSSIDVYDDDFDGWVYPDGRLLNKNIFTKAYAAFGNTYNSGNESNNYFRIPTLDSFIKITSNVNSTLALCLKVNEIKYLKYHSHDIGDILLSGLTTTLLSVLGVNNYNVGGATHSPTNSAKNKVYSADLTFSAYNFKFSGSNNIISATDPALDVSTYPSHILIPVLMYIGVD